MSTVSRHTSYDQKSYLHSRTPLTLREVKYAHRCSTIITAYYSYLPKHLGWHL